MPASRPDVVAGRVVVPAGTTCGDAIAATKRYGLNVLRHSTSVDAFVAHTVELVRTKSLEGAGHVQHTIDVNSES